MFPMIVSVQVIPEMGTVSKTPERKNLRKPSGKADSTVSSVLQNGAKLNLELRKWHVWHTVILSSEVFQCRQIVS